MTTNTTGQLVAADHPLIATVLHYREEARDARLRAALARAELSSAETRAATCERILASHMERLAHHRGAVNRLAELDRQAEAQVAS